MNRADMSRCSNRYHPNPTLEGVPNETSCIPHSNQDVNDGGAKYSNPMGRRRATGRKRRLRI